MICYSLDIGGSSVKHALVEASDVSARVVERYEPILLRSREFKNLRAQVVEGATSVLQTNQSLDAIAISTTGAVARDGIVINAGHFSGYSNVSWFDIFKSEFPQIGRVYTANDGKASTWAEYVAQGREGSVFVHFVVGTGVGGGIVCFDQLVFGDDDSAGNLGHMKIIAESAGLLCSCRRFGCVEPLASGPAVVRAFVALGGELSGAKNGELDEVTRAASAGNPLALQALQEAGGWLGVAISNVMNVLNPKVITVGGGVVVASHAVDKRCGGPYLRSAIERAGALAFEGLSEVTTIAPAVSGNDGGLLGAALLAFQQPVQQ